MGHTVMSGNLPARNDPQESGDCWLGFAELSHDLRKGEVQDISPAPFHAIQSCSTDAQISGHLFLSHSPF